MSGSVHCSILYSSGCIDLCNEHSSTSVPWWWRDSNRTGWISFLFTPLLNLLFASTGNQWLKMLLTFKTYKPFFFLHVRSYIFYMSLCSQFPKSRPRLSDKQHTAHEILKLLMLHLNALFSLLSFIASSSPSIFLYLGGWEMLIKHSIQSWNHLTHRRTWNS